MARVFSVIVAMSMALFLLAPVTAAYADGEFVRTWKEYEKTDDYKAALGNKDAATWNMVADAMDNLFEVAKKAYADGDADLAYEAVNQAYYGYYETTGFERNAMSYIAGSRKTEVENQFSLAKSYAKKGGSVDEFTGAVNTLQEMIRTDANILDGVENEAAAEGAGRADLAAAAAFAGAFGIILREGIEAMLVIGAIVAYLVKARQKKYLRHVYIGALLGVVCSFIVAAILYSLGMGEGSQQQEIIEGVAALIAVVMLYWVSNWMLSKSETEAWNAYIKKQVAGAAATGSVFALAFTAWLAVFREGAEVVLFLFPLVSSTDPVVIWGGIIAGFVVLAIIFVVMRVFSVRLPLKPFFLVMSILMFIMAISFLGSGINELIEGNVIVGTYIPWIPTGNEVLTILGINPWVETIVPQILLLIVTIIIFIVHFRKERKAKEAGIQMAEIEEPSKAGQPERADEPEKAGESAKPEAPEAPGASEDSATPAKPESPAEAKAPATGA